jgi:hypothetical protein
MAIAFGAQVVPAGASAATAHAVSVPASTTSQTFAVACPKPVTGACTGVLTVHQDAHTEFKMLDTGSSVGACTGWSYITGWVQWQQFSGPFWDWTAREDVEDQYNQCSASNVYVNPSCSSGGGWSCGSVSKGAFWDGGRNANTDWDNQYTTFPWPGNATCLTWLRFWTQPNGSSSWASGYQNVTNC